MNWGDGMERSLSETIEILIGDTPVSEQLSAALSYMAPKGHTHDDYASKAEVDKLKKQIELLLELVGDQSVAEQINMALKRQGG
ncbi:MAG: hypothetical protein IJ444_01935 [Kiritimatiellae bacterium]|nr:hypothetical protein [Kiritimatiellia bacterium]